MTKKSKVGKTIGWILAVCVVLAAVLWVWGPFSPRERVALTLSAHSDYPMTEDLHVMADTADCIVVGAFEAFLDTWNMSRDVENPQLPSSQYYIEGELYRFQVDAVLKGEIAESAIQINLPHSERITGEIDNAVQDDMGNVIQAATEFDPYRFDAVYAYYIQPVLGETVILFLDHSPTFDCYYPAIEPYVIVLGPEGDLTLKSNFLEDAAATERLESQYFTSQGGQRIEFRSGMAQTVLTDRISDLTLDQFLEEIGVEDVSWVRETLEALSGTGDTASAGEEG